MPYCWVVQRNGPRRIFDVSQKFDSGRQPVPSLTRTRMEQAAGMLPLPHCGSLSPLASTAFSLSRPDARDRTLASVPGVGDAASIRTGCACELGCRDPAPRVARAGCCAKNWVQYRDRRPRNPHSVKHRRARRLVSETDTRMGACSTRHPCTCTLIGGKTVLRTCVLHAGIARPSLSGRQRQNMDAGLFR